MRPSDKVWASINNRLNRRRRRFGFLLCFSLLVTGGLGYFLVGNPGATHPSQLAAGIPASSLASKKVSTTQLTNKANPQDQTTDIQPSAIAQNILAHNRRNTAAYTSTLVHPLSNDLSTNYTTASTAPVADAFIPTIVDSYDENARTGDNTPAASTQKPATNPLTIESVFNRYQPRTGKLGLQVYFTPTFSYRKLHDNNINNVVTHKPDFGFEIGLRAKYPIARNLKVIGGLQFNVNRYDIKTFNSVPQYATIRLNSGRDSVSAATSYNNFGGYRSNWLENFFFQISAPVGIELRIKGNNRTQFGIATTLQPTYVLGDRAYLLSSDYKNYAEVPRLISRWNMNTSLETFVAYGTGRLKWQVGPQVRYQVFSTYDRKYPVKENLFDFGLKVGISLNNR